MCGPYGQCGCAPETMYTLSISYCHVQKRWRAHECSRTQRDDGEMIEHGNVHYVFGPFDAEAEVLELVKNCVTSAVGWMPIGNELSR